MPPERRRPRPPSFAIARRFAAARARRLAACPARGLALALTLTAFAAPAVEPPSGARTANAELERVRDALGELGAALEQDRIRLGEAREQSFELERTVAESTAKQEALERRITQRGERIDALRARKTEIESRLDESRRTIYDNAAARYVLSFQPKLKVLLHQDDARRLSRNLAYYDYVIGHYRGDALRQHARLRELAQTEAALKLETDKMRRLRFETNRHIELLEAVREERASLIAALDRRLAESANRVEQLRRDEQRLVELLEQLPAAPIRDPASAAFGELEGRLEWPTPGRVASAPGMALRDGGARWAGVLIETVQGTEVRAVADGTVVFADWFRNLGQLVILDHGDGYMSLYGNNERLVRRAGDSVRTGETIAFVGPGEGELPEGLYFELRASGEPLDPRRWCMARR